MSLPREAEIVVVGAGAVGCGVAYSLAKAGKTDVLVVEKGPGVASETSAHAAGLVGQVRTSMERVRLAMWSVKAFRELQQDATAPPSWREVGSLRIALCDRRATEFQRMLSVCREAGLEVESIDSAQAAEICPAMDFRDATSILWCPTDGYLQPNDLALAYYTQSRHLGVKYQMRTALEDIRLRGGRVEAVVTERGAVNCKTVINAAGAHAYHVARLVGLELPIVPVRHEFLVTVEAPGMNPNLPVVRIPDRRLYLRGETDALLVGGWEPDALSESPRDYPMEGSPPRIKDDWETLGLFVTNLSPHYPAVEEVGVRSVFKGWPTFTPDGCFVVGESARVPGFVMAGGCNAHGVSGSAGIGRHVVESISAESPSPYVLSLSPDRFLEQEWDWESARRQAQHVYETYYECSEPAAEEGESLVNCEA